MNIYRCDKRKLRRRRDKRARTRLRRLLRDYERRQIIEEFYRNVSVAIAMLEITGATHGEKLELLSKLLDRRDERLRNLLPHERDRIESIVTRIDFPPF